MELSDEVYKVDMSGFLQKETASRECEMISSSMIQFGAVLVRDPRVKSEDGDEFLDMMERYFDQPRDKKLLDARPEIFYQVGVTPNGIELPRDNSKIAGTLNDTEKPRTPIEHRERDPKWRFFWRCGERPENTDFPELNAEQVVPSNFSGEWREKMDKWGSLLIETVRTASKMLALGIGIPKDSLLEKMGFGPHLLAPTGSDLNTLARHVGTPIAGYHYDINLLTIHGRSRFPGLFIWTRNGKRIPVNVPDGYVLIQSGAQLEYLTGGLIKRGMHEVVVSSETVNHAQQAKQNGKCMWRVSSTLFAHVRSDASLDPIDDLGKREGARSYFGVRAGEQIAEELKELQLATGS